MAKLIYSAIQSLDGYIADEEGKFDWAEPDEDVHTLINDLERPVGTYLLGRRLYEVMNYWDTIALAGQPAFIQDFAGIWRAANKIVYSKTLETASSAKRRIEREFDPDAVRQMKAAAGRDLTVGAPALAPGRSRPGFSTSCTCSSCPSRLETANSPSPAMSASSSNCWTNAASATAWFTSTTAPRRERRRASWLASRSGDVRAHPRWRWKRLGLAPGRA